MVIYILMLLVKLVALADHKGMHNNFKGNVAAWEDFPSFACVWVEGEKRIHVSGVLVKPKAVVTMACVWTSKSINVFTSTVHAGWVYKKKQKQWRHVKKVVIHDNFVKGHNGVPNENDMALVKMSESFIVDNTIKPIELLPSEKLEDLWVRILVLKSLCYAVGTSESLSGTINVVFFEVEPVNCDGTVVEKRKSVICTSAVSVEFKVCPPSHYGISLVCDDIVFGIFLYSDFVCCGGGVKNCREKFLFFTFLGHYLDYFNISHSVNEGRQVATRDWLFIMFALHFILELLSKT